MHQQENFVFKQLSDLSYMYLLPIMIMQFFKYIDSYFPIEICEYIITSYVTCDSY